MQTGLRTVVLSCYGYFYSSFLHPLHLPFPLPSPHPPSLLFLCTSTFSSSCVGSLHILVLPALAVILVHISVIVTGFSPSSSFCSLLLLLLLPLFSFSSSSFSSSSSLFSCEHDKNVESNKTSVKQRRKHSNILNKTDWSNANLAKALLMMIEFLLICPSVYHFTGNLELRYVFLTIFFPFLINRDLTL